jgi:hypothetical protein
MFETASNVKVWSGNTSLFRTKNSKVCLLPASDVEAVLEL